MSLMGTKEIMEIIPHRQPFLTPLRNWNRASGQWGKNASPTMSRFLQAIFPGSQSCPGY